MLAETAHNAGVITNEEFAMFQNAGYMGLYGGLGVDDIHKRKELEVGQNEYSCAMKSHFRKSGNQMSGRQKSSYASLLA